MSAVYRLLICCSYFDLIRSIHPHLASFSEWIVLCCCGSGPVSNRRYSTAPGAHLLTEGCMEFMKKWKFAHTNQSPPIIDYYFDSDLVQIPSHQGQRT
eukprot:372169_1